LDVKRKALALSTTVAVLALAVTTAAQAEPPPPAESAGLYVVQASGTPLASYEGGVPGFRATRPAQGERIDPADVSVRRYRKYLADGRKAVLEKVPGAEKVYDYDTAFNGFAARLTVSEVAKLRQTPGVVRIWKNEVYKLDTISTPAFLGLTGRNGVWDRQYGGEQHAGEGVIIGMVDNGFWPENPAFAALPEPRPDADVIASKWHGTCDPGDDAPENNVACNNKVIGARYYRASTAPIVNEFRSPRDYDGHGSHTASTAAGDFGVDAVVNGIARGKMSGMAPAARLAIYKACWGVGCSAADSIAAINQAVADGVDVINYSISGSRTSVVDPVEVAFYNAARAGVFIATSAGNAGPAASTVAHNSPWVTTVAAGPTPPRHSATERR
jgi:hypothetical protein